MDYRDSSSPLTDSDEDGALSVAAALAKEAALLFQSRKFADCVDVLNQLSKMKEDDPKVRHNIAIAEYCRDGSDLKTLLEVLNNVKNKDEELAHAAGEQAESFRNPGIQFISGSKGNNTSTQQISAVNSASIVLADEFDTSVAGLNIATVWFHLHEYAKAMSILEPLYLNIEPIDETTALHICLLLLDVALASRDASRAADVINYLEKAFGVVIQADCGSAVQQQSSNLVSKSASVPNSTTDTSNLDSVANVNSSENSLSRTLSDEALEYDTLLSSLNLTRAPGVPASNDLSRASTDRSDLKLKLQLYKVRLLVLTRNIKAAKREMKIAMNIARGGDSSMALLLKSQLEYVRGNYRKAIKLLMASSNRMETGTSSIFNNNLGCIHYQLGKPHTSTVFFSRALNNNLSLRKDKPLKLVSFSQDKSLHIIYNCGIQYLACGKPMLAANCFQKASLLFYNRPLLWLRIAECCLMANEKGFLGSNEADKPQVKAHVIGKGKWRHLTIDNRNLKSGCVDSVKSDNWFLGSGQPQLSMQLARQCLVNALHLLHCSESTNLKSSVISSFNMDKNETPSSFDSNTSSVTGASSQFNANGDAKDQKVVLNLYSTIQNSVSEYEDICRRENHLIKQAVLANLAFVELELKNPLKALSTARSLLMLQVSDGSKIFLFLSHVYTAEALCLLNRISEAAQHLFIYLSGGDTVELPFSQQDREQWRTVKVADLEELNSGLASGKSGPLEESQVIDFLSPEEARGTLCINFAAFFALEQDFEPAHHFAKQALSLIPKSPKAIITAVYVDLMLGKTQEALDKLKHCSQIAFLPANFTLNGS